MMVMMMMVMVMVMVMVIVMMMMMVMIHYDHGLPMARLRPPASVACLRACL